MGYHGLAFVSGGFANLGHVLVLGGGVMLGDDFVDLKRGARLGF